MQFTLTAAPDNPTKIVEHILQEKGIQFQEPFRILLPHGTQEYTASTVRLFGRPLMRPYTIYQCELPDEDAKTELHDMKLAFMENEYSQHGTRIYDYDLYYHQPALDNVAPRYPEGVPIPLEKLMPPGLPNTAALSLRKIFFEDISRTEFEQALRAKREAQIHQEVAYAGSPEMK